MVRLINELKAHQEISKEFGRGATSVKMFVEVDNRKTQTGISVYQNPISIMEDIAKINQAEEVKYIRCESDADDWSDLFDE